MTLTMQLADVTAPNSSSVRPAPIPSDESSSRDLEQAVSACNFALVVWDTPGGTIRVANQAAAKLFGVPLSAVPGRRMVDLFAPRDKVEDVIRAFSANAVEVTRTDRHVRTARGPPKRPCLVEDHRVCRDEGRGLALRAFQRDRAPRSRSLGSVERSRPNRG